MMTTLTGPHVAGSAVSVFPAVDCRGRLVFSYGASEVVIPGSLAGLWITCDYPGRDRGGGEVEGGPDGSLTGIALGYCGWTLYPACSPEAVASIDTFTPERWYRLTYGISGEDKFCFYVAMLGGQGGIAMLPVIHLPVASPGGGSPCWPAWRRVPAWLLSRS